MVPTDLRIALCLDNKADDRCIRGERMALWQDCGL
jgi:hypothetical protein